MHAHRHHRLGLTITAALLPLAAQACPLCDSATGQQVRAGIFSTDFITTLLTVLLPFPILLIGVALMHFGLPRFGRSSRRHGNEMPATTTLHHPKKS
jgi:hypothetical protein